MLELEHRKYRGSSAGRNGDILRMQKKMDDEHCCLLACTSIDLCRATALNLKALRSDLQFSIQSALLAFLVAMACVSAKVLMLRIM